MDIQKIFPNRYGPIPKIEEMQELQVKLQRLIDYFGTNDKIKTFNGFTYTVLKTNIVDGLNIPSKFTKIWDSLRDLVNNPKE